MNEIAAHNRKYAKEFLESSCDFRGSNEDTMYALYKCASGIVQNLSEQDGKIGGMQLE